MEVEVFYLNISRAFDRADKNMSDAGRKSSLALFASDETESSLDICGSTVVGLVKKERLIQSKVIGLLIQVPVNMAVQFIDRTQVSLPDKVQNTTLGLETL